MNIGIRLHDTAGSTLAEHLASAQEQGFRCVHLALSKTVPGFTMPRSPQLLTGDMTAQVAQLLSQHEQKLAVLGCYLQLGATDEQEWQWMEQAYRAHLRAAASLGALCVGTETPAPAGVDYRSEEALCQVIQRVKALAACAEEQGVYLAIEPVYRHVVCTPERAERMLDAVRSDHLRIILDAVNLFGTANHQQAQPLVEEAIRRFGDRVVVLHMKDYRPMPGKEDVEALPCGAGLMDYSTLLRFSRARGGLPMTLENTTPSTAVAARQVLEQLDAAL